MKTSVNKSFTLQLLNGCAMAAVLATAGVAPAYGQDDENAGVVLEEIIVTGVRQSLAASVAQKRNANRIVDVITAEDIGELPDSNVAESLQRITGIQMSRAEGQGNTVRIRGLASQVQINGRTLASQDSDRSFSLFNLASDYFQTLQVSKSVVASQTEGTLGGVINLVTRRPLDIDGTLISLSGAVGYEELADDAGVELSGTFAETLVEEKLGVLATVSYSQRGFRQDEFESRGGWQALDIGVNTGFDFNEDGVENDVLRARDLRFTTEDDSFERYGIDGSVQWRPTDKLEVRFDGNYSKFARERNRYFLQIVGSTAMDTNTAVISDSGTLMAGTWDSQDVRPDGRLVPDVHETLTAGANAKWTNDDLTIAADFSISRGTRDLVSQFLRYGLSDRIPVSFDFRTDSGLPDVALDDGNLSLTDPSLYQTNLVFDRLITYKTVEKAGKLDASYDFRGEHMSALSVGVRFADRDFAERWYQTPTQATIDNYPALFDSEGNPLTAGDAPLSQFVTDFPFSDGMFPGYDGNFPTAWFVGTYPVNSLSVGSTDFSNNLNLRANGFSSGPGSHADIEEKTIAGFFMADFEGTLGGMNYFANAGVRVVHTDITSGGFAAVSGAFVPVEVENDYTNVLPAANIAFTVSENLMVRFAAAKVLQRPDINALKTGFSVNQTALTATGGNPNLDPFQATQLDASVEYYVGDDGLVSAAFFYKDVKNFITSDTVEGKIPGITGHLGEEVFLISRPVNGGGAEIKGLEFSFQQAFTGLPGFLSGTGMVANYTYSDADTDEGIPLPSLSKHTFNLIGYYDKGPLDVRLAYTYRSKFQQNGQGGNSAAGIGLFEYNGSQGFLDASAGYDINDTFRVQIEAMNLTDTEEKIYLEIPERLSNFKISGRRFRIGMRAQF